MLGVEKYHRLRLGVHRNYSLEITLGVEKYHRLRLGVHRNYMLEVHRNYLVEAFTTSVFQDEWEASLHLHLASRTECTFCFRMRMQARLGLL
jgi:peptidyl-tRNA hydrolase